MASLPSATWSAEPVRPAGDDPVKRKGNIKQSVSRWCYQKIPLEQLCEYSAKIGLKAVDLLEIAEWEVPKRYGLICSMGYGGGGTIASAMNRVENHAKIEEEFRKSIPLAAKAGVPNVITFSGNSGGFCATAHALSHRQAEISVHTIRFTGTSATGRILYCKPPSAGKSRARNCRPKSRIQLLQYDSSTRPPNLALPSGGAILRRARA